MSSDPPELGKGLFGYRKSAVNQIIADRDIMLRQAEGRVRAAESKVADLEAELGSMRDRNTRMDEQIERLRLQLDALTRSGAVAPVEQSPAPEPPAAASWEDQPSAPGAAAEVDTYEADTYMEEPSTPAYQEPIPAYDEQQPVAPFGEEPTSPVYGDEESLEGGRDWPGAEQDWTGAEEPAPMVEAEAGATASLPDDDDMAYGVEVQLGEGTGSEPSEPAWMHTGPAADETPAEQDEVAMAAGGYGFGDYDSPRSEEPTYGAYGSEEHEEATEQAETPSPFSRFPFTSEPEPYESSAAEAPSSVEAGAYEEEPVSHAPATETPAYAAEAPRAEPPQPAEAHATERPSAVSPETTDITNRFLTEELAGVLAAAEESAARIVERARATTQRQIARSNRVWREVQAEVARFASWREEVEPVIRTVQSKVEGVRAEIEEVPERIRQALAPMADSISSIDGDLADLAAACNPPLLLAPGGLEAEDADHASWDHEANDEGSDTHAEASEDAFDESFGASSEEPYGRSFRENEGDEGSGHLYAG